MLTTAQLHALDSFIGEDGIYIETIREATCIDSGTKQLYLGRAVSMGSGEFCASLDKLYQPGQTEEEKQEILSVIRSLKFINDLFNNNEIALPGPFGVKPILEATFSGLGEVDHEAFRENTRRLVTSEMRRIVFDSGRVATSRQKAKRLEQEKTIRPAMGWRQKLGLLVNGVISRGAQLAQLLSLMPPEQQRTFLQQDNFSAFREAASFEEGTVEPAPQQERRTDGAIIRDGAALAEALRALTPEQIRELLQQDNFSAFREASNPQVRARPQ